MIEERGVKLEIEEEKEPTKDSEVFYNSEMVRNRDISIAALQTYNSRKKNLRILDALSGSGIRALRYAKEVGHAKKVTANDLKPEAYENIQKNAKINGLDLETTNQDANALMSSRRKEYDFIDIDPFGSPLKFADSAVRSIDYEGFAGFTATDLAPLCGTYKKTCMRRYGSKPYSTSYCHELGLRILMKSLFEAFARFDKVFRPKISFAQKHYYRVLGELRETKKGVNRMLDSIGYLKHCKECGFREMVEGFDSKECKECGGDLEIIGPLWIGKLGREDFAEDSLEKLEEKEYTESAELLQKCKREYKIKKPYYDTHNLASILKVQVPRLEDLIEKLRDKGYQAELTHFSDTGIRTYCPISDLKSVIREVSGS
ncbi:MAG: tRNA (guanine(10)-N(2))-dimethyltransferase [Candidatus Nanohaloarchaeota archaeon QJJ-9]|nr:tRNA (guanine(10)-N(2))-dimethyltransferase [Candidatus Nanohaloarchaeota archaeon QJJ-9]